MGNNKHMLRDPILHRFAIYYGISVEKLSILAEDHLIAQMLGLPIPDIPAPAMATLLLYSKYVKHHNDEVGYHMEDFVDHKVGMTIGTLMDLLKLGKIIMLSGKSAQSEVENIYKSNEDNQPVA